MKDEYAKVGVPMLPVVRGEDETRRQILLYTVLLYAVTQLPFCAGGLRRRSTSPPRWCSGSGFIAGAITALPAGGSAQRAAAVPVLAGLPGAAVLRDGRGCPPMRSAPGRRRLDRGSDWRKRYSSRP